MARRPKADWKFFPCQIGEDVAFIFVDVAAHDDIQDAPTSLVKLRVRYRSPRPNGLPTNAEFEAVRAIEVALERFAGRGRDRYVGRITRGGYRVFYVYSRRSKDDWRAFLERAAKQSGYELALAFRSDKRHTGYLQELYPSEDDWQVISDLDVINVLSDHGDLEKVKRRIDHWSYFPDAIAAAKFVAWATQGPHKHVPRWSGLEEDGQHCVRLYHVGSTRQQDISHHTILLNRKASELGGRYDGWETRVVSRTTKKKRKVK